MTSENPSYTTQLEFLCSLDFRDGMEGDLEGLEDQNCPDCHEPYSINSWEVGKKVEYPVRRVCGQLYGLKCLTRMAISEELGRRVCLECNASHDTMCSMDWMEPDNLHELAHMEPDTVRELATIDMAIQTASSTAVVSRDLGWLVNWSKILMQVYEASYISCEGDDSPGVVTPDYVFSRPLLLLEVALRTKGFFKSDYDMPNVPQLQQDLNNLRKRLDSRPALPKEWYMPEIEVMMSKADLRRTAFVTAVNELNAEKGEIGWTKHQQDSLQQETQWFFWQKVMILLLVFLAGLLVFLAATWGVLTEKE